MTATFVLVSQKQVSILKTTCIQVYVRSRLLAVPQDGHASEEIETANSWPFRPLESCRAYTRLTEEGLLAVWEGSGYSSSWKNLLTEDF